MKLNYPEKEKEILEFWEKNNIFKKSLAKPSPKGPFVFFEGPPTANGRPGIHHAESRAFKDCIPRFKTMQGYQVNRKGGWDTHGLPVEIEVEKKLGFTSKQEIEKFGIDKFNAECKESVWNYQEEWEEFTRRLGFWLDLENAYVTYKPEYVESLWWAIKQIWDKQLLYKDYRVTPHCPRCGTSLSSHELSQGYKKVTDPAVFTKFKVVDKENEYLVAWTTTPWTLPSNVALAVGEKIDYVLVLKDGEKLWLAKALAGKVLPTFAKATAGKEGLEVLEEKKGKDLVGMKYEPLFPYIKEALETQTPPNPPSERGGIQSGWTVVPADFVSTEDGSGIVHTAVMYGADDFALGNEIGLPKYHLVDLEGKFTKEAGPLAGKFVKDADAGIMEDLRARNLILKEETVEHEYPFCWRCKSPVIYYAKDSWYIKMTDLRETMIAENEKINWEPAYIKEGRFGEWLRDVKDWAFSRERYWGTPLPIWECQECDHRDCIGSFAELKEKALVEFPPLTKGGQGGVAFDPHRPFVDEVEIKCEKCGGVMKRVPDVCDVWFDSGCMPWAQWHYPFENKAKIDEGEAYPADYISEAIDQTRGWFYTLLAVSTLLCKERPYKNVICLGHVLDAKGKKMSKSIGNVVNPMEKMDKYGADAVRWYMYTLNQPGESKRFDEKALVDMVRQNFTILQNVVSFYQMYETEESRHQGSIDSDNILDKWILARLHTLIKEATADLENYKITEPTRAIGNFITDLSTWYLRRSRERFKSDNEADKQLALQTLHHTLAEVSKLMAPFTPFLAEDVYGQVENKKESVHLEDWPVADLNYIDQEVLDKMGQTRSIVSRALEARTQAGINVRQPLGMMSVTLPAGQLADDYIEVLKDEVNVKQVEVEKGEYAVSLNTDLTPQLVREGAVREIVRRVNAMRKNAKLTIEDRIEVYVSGDDEVVLAVDEHKDYLLHGTLALGMLADEPEGVESFRVHEMEVKVGFVKK